MQLQGSTFIQNNSNTNAGGEGMFNKETLTFQSLNKYQRNMEGCENLWITADINNTKKSLGFYIGIHKMTSPNSANLLN